MLSSLGNCF